MDARSLVCPVLVGRDDLLAHVGRRRSEAAAGRGGILLLAGEAGIGKSRLLGLVERAAAEDGFAVGRGMAYPTDVEVTGGVVLDLARSLGRTAAHVEAGRTLERLLAATGTTPTSDGGGDRHRRRRILVLDAVDALAGVAATTPALLSLEDLHWADDLTLDILAALARRLPELPLQVVATYRSDELFPTVPLREWRARILAGRLAEELRVGRLDAGGTGEMVTAILADGLPAPSQLVASIHERSDGIPLHVEELLALVRDAGGSGAASTIEVSDTLEQAIRQRAAGLPEVARAVAEAASVIGRSFDVAQLSSLTERPVEALEPVIDDLERAFFIVPTVEAGRFDFRHAIIREVVYAQIDRATRRRLHGRVADATVGDPRAGPAFRSVHLEAAGRTSEAFEAAMEGSRRAISMSAHRDARELLSRARRNLPPSLTSLEGAGVAAALADEAAATDANVDADRLYQEASELYAAGGAWREVADLVPRHVAVRHLLGDDLRARSSRLTAGLDLLDGLPDDDLTRAVRGRLLAGLSAAHMLDRRLEPAIEYGDESRRISLGVGDVPTALDASVTLGSCFVFAGRMTDGWRLLEASLEEAREAQLETSASRAYRMLGSCSSVLVEYDRAERSLRDGIEYAERVELWNHRYYMASHLAHVLWATGAWTEAELVAARALSDGRGGVTTRITCLHVIGYIALGRGDAGRAIEALEEARALGEGMGELQRLSPALWGLAEATLLAGDARTAIRWCLSAEAASLEVDDAAYVFPFLVTGARAYLALGNPSEAGAWVERVAATVEARGIPGTLPAVDHARGLVELAHGATGRARSSLEAARAGWLERRRAWEGTWATLDLAELHARAGRPVDAARLADAALRLGRELGAAPLVAAAEALGRRIRSRSDVDAPWAPLTSRELEVSQRIAEGMTNAEIAEALRISPRTVTSHVEHILAKLGATRRAEVAAWVVGIGAGPEQLGERPGERPPDRTAPGAGSPRGPTR